MSIEENNPFLTPEDQPLDQSVDYPTVDEVTVPETVVDTAEFVETSNRVNDIVDTVDALESIAIQLRKAQKYGGVSAESYGFLKVATDAACMKFPKLAKLNNQDFPSMEDFAIKPLEYTDVSLESIGDKIKQGIKALIEFLKKLVQHVMAFFGNIVSGATIEVRKSEKLRDELKTVRKDKGNVGSITFPGVLNNPVFTTKQLENLNSAINTLAVDNYIKLKDTLRKIRFDVDNTAADNFLTQMPQIFKGYAELAKEPLLGNLSFKNDAFPPTITILDAEPVERAAIKVTDLDSVLTSNIELGNSLSEMKKSSKDRADALTRLTATGVDLMDQIKSKQTGEARQEDSNWTQYRKYVKSFNLVLQWELKIVSRALITCRAVNSVCAASIKLYQA